MWGILIGLGMPIIGTFLMLSHYHPIEPSAKTLFELHLTHPILLLVDTTPFFLGTLMALLGLKQHQLLLSSTSKTLRGDIVEELLSN